MSSKTVIRAAMEEGKKIRTASPAKDTKKKSKVADESKVVEVVPEKSDSSNKEPKEAVKSTEKPKSDKKEKTSVESKDAGTKGEEKVTPNLEKNKSPGTKGKGKKEPEIKVSKEKANVSEHQKKVDVPKSEHEEKASTSQTKEPKSNVPEPETIAAEPKSIAPETKSVVPEPKSVAPEPKSNVQEPKSNVSEPKSNGSNAKLNGSNFKVNGSGSKSNGAEPANGHNGDTMETIDLDNDDDCVMSGPEQDNDEHFPELSYDDTSDNDGFEPSTPEFLGVNRSITRRSQAKSTATPETPKSLSRVATAEPRSDSASTLSSAEEEAPKIQKTKQESDTMRLRSSDTSIIDDKSEEIQSQSELNAANLLKTDTNFSKSRIKISPYRRGARPLDSASMIVNYTGSNTTLNDSFNTSNLSDKSSEMLESDSSQMSSLRSIKGRRSYKELREVTLRSVTLQRIKDKAKEANKAKMESLAVAAQADTTSVPIAQVVGRKRRTSNTGDVASEGDPDLPQVGAKRARLLQRVVVSPFSSLMSRGRSVLASSTPLTERRTVPQVLVESYADLPNQNTFDDIKTNVETNIIVDSQTPRIDLEVGQSAVVGEAERKRCSIM